jgi:prevent-host-death family protein
MEPTLDNPTIDSRKFRKDLAEILTRVKTDGDHIQITENGKPVAALIPIVDLEFYEEMEDRLDIKAVEEAWEEQGDDPLIPWEQVKKELDSRYGS